MFFLVREYPVLYISEFFWVCFAILLCCFFFFFCRFYLIDNVSRLCGGGGSSQISLKFSYLVDSCNFLSGYTLQGVFHRQFCLFFTEQFIDWSRRPHVSLFLQIILAYYRTFFNFQITDCWQQLILFSCGLLHEMTFWKRRKKSIIKFFLF